MLYINPDRPTEELIGDNRGIVRQKLGRIHCCTNWRDAYREIRSGIKNWKAIPPELRRGLAKCVHDTLAEYRGTFVSVMYRMM